MNYTKEANCSQPKPPRTTILAKQSEVDNYS